MFRIVCHFFDKSQVTVKTKDPVEAVTRLFRSYEGEIKHIEITFNG